MLYIVFASIIILILGILYFSKQLTPGKKPRGQFLRELEDFLEAPLEPIKGYQDSCRIAFTFEKHQFIYEDYFTSGFGRKLNESQIKGRTNTQFTLIFSEKEGKPLYYDDIRKSKSPGKKPPGILMPKPLKRYAAYSNMPRIANKLLRQSDVVQIFSEFRNLDHRGLPILTLKIVNGMVILFFHPSGLCHPKPLHHLANFESLEEYLDKLIVVMNRIELLNK